MNITTITNQQAKGKRFATVRFHDGYDIDQVDACLEELEESVRDLEMRQSVLEEANGLLRLQVTHAHSRADAAEAELERLQAEGVQQQPAPLAEPAPVADSVHSTTSRAAARLLEIATSESESLVEEARREAEQILAEARAEADLLTQSTLEEVATRHDELATRQAQVEERLASQEDESQARVSRLLDIEHQYRTHLVTFFQAQLDQLGQPSMAETVTVGEAELTLADSAY